MRETTIGSFLNLLAARTPTPGGGASAAIQVAHAAALLEMVARYSDGPRYDDDREAITADIADCQALRARALAIADDELAVFEPIAAALALPKNDEAERDARSKAVTDALESASQPPIAILEVANQLMSVAEQLEKVGSRSLISDVGCAAETLRSAAAVAQFSIDANTRRMSDSELRSRLVQQASSVDDIKTRADDVSAHVRSHLQRPLASER